MTKIDVKRLVMVLAATTLIAVVLSVLEQRVIGLPVGLESNVLVALTAIALVYILMWLLTSDVFWFLTNEGK